MTGALMERSAVAEIWVDPEVVVVEVTTMAVTGHVTTPASGEVVVARTVGVGEAESRGITIELRQIRVEEAEEIGTQVVKDGREAVEVVAVEDSVVDMEVVEVDALVEERK